MTVFVMLCYVLLFQYNLVQYIKFAFMQIMLIYVNVYMYLCWNKKFFTIYIYFICFFCHFVRTDIGLKQLDMSPWATFAWHTGTAGS